MNDSLVAGEHSPIIYNNIYLTNRSNRVLPLTIIVDYPSDWNIVGKAKLNVVLRPGVEEIIPLTFSRQPNTRSAWQPVQLKIYRPQYQDTSRFRFFLFSEVRRKFSIEADSDLDIALDQNDRTRKVGVVLKNRGNAVGNYNVAWKSEFLKVNQSNRIILHPGKDTTLYCEVGVSSSDLSMLKSELLNFIVKETDGGSSSLFFKINNVSSFKKEHASAYNTADVAVSTGLLNYGDEAITYYFGASGHVTFNDTSFLTFNYRSKQYGILNMYEKNVFNATLKLGKWTLDAGQVNDSRYYLNFGNTIRLNYRGSNAAMTAWVSKHYAGAYLSNDHGGLSVKYGVGKMKLRHTIAVNHDPVQKVSSGIVDNHLQLLNTQKVSLAVTAGAGVEQTPPVQGIASQSRYGLSLGYSFRYNAGESWTIVSEILKNGKYYPGVSQGLERNYQEIRWNRNSISAGVFYQKNAIARNYFRDSLFNSDVFTYNTERYGARLGWGNKKMSLLFSAGKLTQTGVQSFLPKYNFFEIHYQLRASDRASLNFTSINTFSGVNGKQNLIGTNTNLFARYRNVGLSAVYVRVPLHNTGGNGAEGTPSFSETLNLSPQIGYTFFKTLSASVNYNFSKYLNNTTVTQYIGGSVSYNGIRNGLAINLNTSLPLQSTENDNYAHFYNVNYFTLTLSKQLNIPLIHKRKYHDISLQLFSDLNNNGRRDEGEAAASDVQLSINEVPFKSDANGRVVYKNVKSDSYQILLSRNSRLEGVVPANGYVYDTLVDSRTSIQIPYKKARIVSGRVNVVQDSNKNRSFSPDRIKVILKGGNEDISTITDDNGYFSFNVPAGVYSVSLNPEAFGDEFKPVRYSLSADVRELEKVDLTFTIRQKSREVRIQNFSID